MNRKARGVIIDNSRDEFIVIPFLALSIYKKYIYSQTNKEKYTKVKSYNCNDFNDWNINITFKTK